MSPAASEPATTVFSRGLWKDNPVFVQVLGMCPVLAVTNTVMNSLVMGLATSFVLVASAIIVSLSRRVIPKQVRIASYILIIATFVTMADYIIQAVSLEIHRALGAFISLIVVNCIILGRAEAFSSRNPVFRSVMDAVGMGAGFTVAIVALGTIRELLGSGTWMGLPVFGPSFEPWVVMVLPGGAFFVLGLLLLLVNLIGVEK
ncbi:MAG: electron transport complex subunit RsxE [Rhodothermales bacterium]|nr:electron transport complex subunit RsxE [Rhodothermales bacterium]